MSDYSKYFAEVRIITPEIRDRYFEAVKNGQNVHGVTGDVIKVPCDYFIEADRVALCSYDGGIVKKGTIMRKRVDKTAQGFWQQGYHEYEVKFDDGSFDTAMPGSQLVMLKDQRPTQADITKFQLGPSSKTRRADEICRYISSR